MLVYQRATTPLKQNRGRIIMLEPDILEAHPTNRSNWVAIYLSHLYIG